MPDPEQKKIPLKRKINITPDVAYWCYLIPVVALACTIVMWPVLSASNDLFPYGVDTVGHLTRVEHLAARWKNLQFSDWFPAWYNGATMVQYYPPLSIWAGAFIQLFTGSIMLTFKIFAWVCLFLGGIFTALLSKKMGGNVVAGTAAALLFPLSNYTIWTVFNDGTLGNTISLVLYPLFTMKMLDLCEKPCIHNWLFSSFLMSLLVLSHAMQSYLIFIAVFLFCIIHVLTLPWAWKRLFIVLEATFTGIALTAFWAVPGVTQWENPGVPWFPTGIHETFVLSPINFLFPGLTKTFSYQEFILSLIGTVLCFFIIKKVYVCLKLVIPWVIPTSLSMGPINPLYRLLPFQKSISPIRFLNVADLPAALIVGVLVQGITEWIGKVFRRQGKITFLWFILVLLIPFYIVFSSSLLPISAPVDFAKIRFLVDSIPISEETYFAKGRIATELPDTGSEQAYIPASSSFNNVYGWNIEGTVHHQTILDRNISFDEGYYDYIMRNWYLFNVRTVLFDRRFGYLSNIADYIQERGWTFLSNNGDITMFSFNDPSGYLMKLHSDVLVIGRGSYYLARLFPWVSEGRVENPLKYDEEYIDLFKVIYLYDLPELNIAELEKRIAGWLAKGKTVILDLSAADRIPEIFDVWHSEAPVGGMVNLMPADSDLYENKNSFELKEGRGAVYRNLDQALLYLDDEKGSPAVIGLKQTGEGLLYFTGLHIPRLIHPDFKEEARQLLEPLLNLGDPRKGIIPEPFETIWTRWDHKGVEFAYESKDTQPVIISVTYTPRWHLSLDGERFQAYRHENLILLILPPGEHTVTMRYGPTSAVYTGWLVTALAAGWLIWRGRKIEQKYKQEGSL